MNKTAALKNMALARDIGMKGDIERAYRIARKNEEGLRDHYGSQLLYGSLAAMLAKYDEAEMAALRAFDLDNASYDAAVLLAKIYVNLNNRDGALKFSKLAYQILPSSKEAAIYYAVELHHQGDPKAAEEILIDLYKRDRSDPDVASLLGMMWANAGHFSQALMVVEGTDYKNNENIEFLSRYFEILISNGKASEAKEVARKCIGIIDRSGGDKRQLASAWEDLGAAHMAADEADEAMRAFDMALAINPASKQALVNKAALYKSLERFGDAVACYKAAALANPDDPRIYHHLNNILRDMGFLEESARYGEMALAARPGNVHYQTNLGTSYFCMGRLKDAWPLYEGRLNESSSTYFELGIPVWQGEALDGKRLLVLREQGVGDELLFSSMLLDLPANAAKIGFGCQPKLYSLMKRTFPEIDVFSIDACNEATLRDDYDYVISLASLGKFYRNRLEDFAGKAIELVLDEGLAANLQERVAALPAGLRVAFSWRSIRRGLRRDHHYPDLEFWQPLFDLPGIQWVCAQYGISDEEVADLRARLGDRFHLFEDVDHLDDLDASAALLRACDLVMAPCNTISVLGACVGRPVLRMGYCIDYFMFGTEHYPWLPTVQPMLRAYDESWTCVFARLRQILAGLTS
ncbi:tetratricopeptide repeat protein [Chitinilyticum aquatile]|uniref:tetratricopeptide repeat protein n=1 Tax=Chitinilyticum aquatile TaxID=362520 RepID=UPI0004056BAD|nr:tetratricopeptide repeat protein [Chitinilyticum aquatile]